MNYAGAYETMYGTDRTCRSRLIATVELDAHDEVQLGESTLLFIPVERNNQAFEIKTQDDLSLLVGQTNPELAAEVASSLG